MDHRSLERFSDVLHTLDLYLGDGVAERTSTDSMTAVHQWYQDLESQRSDNDGLVFHPTGLQGFFDVDVLCKFRGELEFCKRFYFHESAEGKSASMRLGTMVGKDAFTNGHRLGGHLNQYEPRDYHIPEELLREGANDVRMNASFAWASLVIMKAILGGDVVDISLSDVVNVAFGVSDDSRTISFGGGFMRIGKKRVTSALAAVVLGVVMTAGTAGVAMVAEQFSAEGDGWQYDTNRSRAYSNLLARLPS